MSDLPTVQDVIGFWRDAGAKAWFAKDAAFDAAIRDRFEPLHDVAARGDLNAWAETPEGALALLLLLDQFPRNMYRGTAHAFATDPLALSIAKAAVAKGFDKAAPEDLRVFFYLPFEHAERLDEQDRCVDLVQGWIEEGGDADQMRWVKVHRDIIERFGRFPHRNRCLGRHTTAEEQAFLDGGGFSG